MSSASATTRLSTPSMLIMLFGFLSSILMLGSLGCRSSRDNQIDLLERELRVQEDYIYELEDYVMEYSEKLRQVRCIQPHAVVTRSKTSAPELAPKKQVDKQPTEEPFEQPLDSEEPEPDESQSLPLEELAPEELEIPELKFESPEPVGQLDEFPQEDIAFAPAFKADGYVSPAEYLGNPSEEESFDTGYHAAERLVIIDVLRSDDTEEIPISLLAVVEARDENDEPVDLDGKVSLMVMTADSVSPQRLKRWDFNDEETASAWQSSQLGDGLHLELPLDESVMSEEPLELWVRLVRADGSKLLAQLPLQWEQLIPVDVAMDSPQLLESEDMQLVENNAQPLQRQEPGMLQSVEQELTQSNKKKSSKAKPQWRASMQQTHPSAGGYSTTASYAKGWKSQSTGGREPLPQVTLAGRTPHDFSASSSNGTTQEEPPHWAPPNVANPLKP